MKQHKKLHPRQFTLLTELMNHPTRGKNRIFNKVNNCFCQSQSSIVTITNKSKSTISRLFNTLKERDLLRQVSDIEGNLQWMLNPSFMYSHYSNHYVELFYKAVYGTGCYSKAQKWRLACLKDGLLYDYNNFCEVIDFDTGEITYGPHIRKLSALNQREFYNSFKDDFVKHSVSPKTTGLCLPETINNETTGDLDLAS